MSRLIEFLWQSGTEILETIGMLSYDTLVVVGLFSLILYVFGWEKGKNIGFMCPAIYVIIQILTKCLVK